MYGHIGIVSTCVMKFGGAAMNSVDRIKALAQLIRQRVEEWDHLVVVVSAMGGATDKLMDLAKEVHPSPPKREQDMLISVGERISMSLLAMALDRLGIEAISFTGSQAGIVTTCDHSDAEIVEVRASRVREALLRGKVVIVAGFQGVSLAKEITTLGRGGSDTSAVALAIELGASRVEFYKDVPGIGRANPKVDPNTEIFQEMSYDETLRVVGEGAEVLHHKCLEMAKRGEMPLEIRYFEEPEVVGTRIERSVAHV